MSSSSAVSAPAAATARASSRRRAPVRAAAQHSGPALERDRGVRQVEAAQLEALAGPAQPALHAGDLEREQVGSAALLEHVEKRPCAPVQARERVLGHDRRAHEHAHDAAQHPHQGAVHERARSVAGGLFPVARPRLPPGACSCCRGGARRRRRCARRALFCVPPAARTRCPRLSSALHSSPVRPIRRSPRSASVADSIPIAA